MKSFWIGAAIAVVIAVIAGTTLTMVGPSSADKFSTSEVRLGAH